MKVYLAEYAGFCFGVRRIAEMIENELEKSGEVYALGEPIHNPIKVGVWKARGLRVIEKAEELPEGATVIVRAHGVPKKEWEILEQKAGKILDGTCPLVRKVYDKAEYLLKNGYYVVIAGDPSHPEVKAEMSFLTPGKYTVYNGKDENVPTESIKNEKKKVGVVAQTTLSDKLLRNVVEPLIGVEELLVFNTICYETHRRQSSAKNLASRVDLMIVIGGKNSSNAAKLYQICSEIVETYHIESADEFQRQWCVNRKIIGVTAGASTPDEVIESTIKKIESLCGKESKNE